MTFHTVKTLKELGLPDYEAKALRLAVMSQPAYLTRVMTQANTILGGHGEEAVQDSDSFWLHYINMGDTYDMTLTYYRGKYRYCSWGDIVEANPDKFDN